MQLRTVASRGAPDTALRLPDTALRLLGLIKQGVSQAGSPQVDVVPTGLLSPVDDTGWVDPFRFGKAFLL